MAKKSNKTAHVLDVITKRTGGAETDTYDEQDTASLREDAADTDFSDFLDRSEEALDERQMKTPATASRQAKKEPAAPKKSELESMLSHNIDEDDPLAEILKHSLEEYLENETGIGIESQAFSKAEKMIKASDTFVSNIDLTAEDMSATDAAGVHPAEVIAMGTAGGAGAGATDDASSAGFAGGAGAGATDGASSAGFAGDAGAGATNGVSSAGFAGGAGAGATGLTNGAGAPDVAGMTAADVTAANVTNAGSADAKGLKEGKMDEEKDMVSQADTDIQSVSEKIENMKSNIAIAKKVEKKEPSYIFVNVAEEVVRDKAPALMKQCNMCTCDRCLNDVVALTLNHLPPKYVVTLKGKLFAKISAGLPQHQMDLVAKITEACEKVKANSRHE